MDILKGAKSSSSEALLPVDAREKTASGIESTTDNRQRPASTSKMTFVRRTIMVLLLCTLVLLGVASASPAVPCHKGATKQQAAAETPDMSSFSTMLKSASPSSLHELLHRFLPDRFRDGVFPSDHQAMEAVHRADAALATSILQLAKREETNSTTSSASPTPTATATETETETKTETETSPPPSETSTSTTVNPPSSSSTSVEPPSTSSVPPATSTTSRSPTPSSTPPSSLPETTLTTSTVPPATTTRPPRTSKEVVTTFTSTSPNGVVVTVTAVTFVPADAGETQAPAATNSPPTLQNFASRGRNDGSILAGAIGFAFLLLMV